MILTGIALTLGCTAQAQPRPDSRAGDEAVLEMANAFRQNNRQRLSQLLPLTRGHVLEPWAAYWDLRSRLDIATPAEVQEFFTRHAGSYQEDRLRNDWLLQLGSRREWPAFLAEYAHFRMRDDPQVRCYAVLAQHLADPGAAPAAGADEVRRTWLALREPEDACTLAASTLIERGQGRGRMTVNDAWRKARLATEANRPRVAAAAVEIAEPEALPRLAELNASPAKFLTSRVFAATKQRKELTVLALIRLAATDLENAAGQLENKWGPMLTSEERNWTWGVIGKQAAQRLDDDALDHFAKVSRDTDLTDDMLAWKTRAALRSPRGPQWKLVLEAVNAMSEDTQRDSAWVYWKARALRAIGGDDRRAEAQRLLEGLASPRGFYEQLALEDIGQKVMPPPRAEALSDDERAAARANPSLVRGLHAIALGLRSEGVREWNYGTNLAQPGGMGDRELIAAAQLACEREVWDRCINTSERSRAEFDYGQRFPMPHRDALVRRSRQIELDPAYVYGLIRQESRFVTDARSSVGAQGLMQVMPATGRWTAKRIGLAGYAPDKLADRDTNIAIGTGYLKLVLDDFGGSMPLAAAAYNAGPSRSRNWRNGPVLEAAAWAENVPFAETRDYVKKVLANTTMYAAILSGQPQSLRARLGVVGPREAAQPEPNRDLP